MQRIPPQLSAKRADRDPEKGRGGSQRNIFKPGGCEIDVEVNGEKAENEGKKRSRWFFREDI